MAVTIQSEAEQRHKAVSLFSYLKELSELRTKTIRTWTQYDKVLWLADVPRETGFRCAAWFGEPNADDETWIEAHKPPPRSPAPDPPAEVGRWLDPLQMVDSSLERPELRPRLPIIPSPTDELNADDQERKEEGADDEEEAYESLDEHPEILDSWDRYVEQRWMPWAKRDRRLRAAQAVYTDLFSIYQRQQRLGEQYEVVLGLGLLSWRTPPGAEVQRHLVTAQASLAFDAVKGVITVGPAAEGPALALEQDMLEAQDRPEVAEQRTIEGRLADLDDALWEPHKLASLFSAWVHAVSANGTYGDALARNPALGGDPVVHLTPALILRKRGERSLIRVFDGIIDQLEGGADIPLGVQRLIDIVDDADARTAASDVEPDDATGIADADDGDIYFPLPANAEQLEIVERLRTRQGVLVQGPPGTGKSHTIANLICHLLATGQRVLVTSHTARALQVLHDKIPADVASLCVSLLGNDRAALAELENAVQGITNRYDQWDSSRHQRDIERREVQLDEARRAEAALQAEQRSVRERETHQHALPFGGYVGTAAAIAERIGTESARFSWMADRPDEATACPLQPDEATELLGLLRTLTPDRVTAASQSIPSTGLLPSPADFAERLRAEATTRAASDAARAGREHPSYPAVAAADETQRLALLDGLHDLQRRQAGVTRQVKPWVHQAAADILTGQDRVWRHLRDVTREHLRWLEPRARETDARQITGLLARERPVVKTHATDLLTHFEAGGGKGLGPFRPKPVKDGRYLLTDVSIDGRFCDEPAPLRDLLAWIEVQDRLDALRQYWAPYDAPAPGPVAAEAAGFRDLLDALEEAVQLGETLLWLQETLSAIPGVVEPPLTEEGPRAALIDAVVAADLAAALRETEAPFHELEQMLGQIGIGPNPHLVVATMLDAVRGRDAHRYAEGYDLIRSIEADRLAIAQRDAFLTRLRTAAPRLVAALTESPADPGWDERIGRWDAGWDWARASAWLERREDPTFEAKLRRDLVAARDRIHTAIRDLAAAKAWAHFFARMTEEQRQHLMAWTRAMAKIGKGTGKRAAQHRRVAREHMDGCRAAIPAWVMPLYRVAESVRPGVDAFDVVIVDEASQSGPEALLLQYLAKKIVVVGDNQQISPDFIGIDREEVDTLRRRHIAHLPFNHVLGVDDSFFDQAVIRYSGRTRLREHFRCMPEIIQFSNNLCYQADPLIPLRQYGADRLEPVKVTQIADGYRQAQGAGAVNPPEADVIVKTIIRCCGDPAYDEKSMGVISLQGEWQAQFIEKLLLEELGPEEMERRQIVCGDAYAFQGDERDVMFLSLVAAVHPEHRIGTLSDDKSKRRFNVAASRARDQMWLFHTATLNDLNPNCMRYKLLAYCRNPAVEPITFDGVVPDDDELAPPFESLFEQRVFRKISERGYRVLPQVPVAGYRIDLVVEGLKGRMAVECDGDAWHGPEQYDADMARQRQLERCGWIFWRVRGSAFYRDPDRSLDELWRLLDKLEIAPAAIAATDGLVSVSASGSENGAPVVNEPLAQPAPIRHDDGTSSGGLPPYEHWQQQPLPNPKEAAIEDVMAGLVEIVTAEGPMPCNRAYRLYARAAGVDEVDRQTRSAFYTATFRAIHSGRLTDRDEWGIPGQQHKIVRAAGCPAVRVRDRGDRMLNEIPPAEIAAAMRSLAPAEQAEAIADPEPHFARLLAAYGLDRTPGNAWQDDILENATPFLGEDIDRSRHAE